MATILVLSFLIFISTTIATDLYPIVSFNNTYLEKNVCYMTNIDNKNHGWCKFMASESILPTTKTCVLSNNENFPNLNEQTIINEWIDQTISMTNCSYYLSLSMTSSQKRFLTVMETIVLLILFLPFMYELCINVVRYFLY